MKTSAPRPVLVAVGSGDAHHPSLRLACREAARAEVPLLLVHVVDTGSQDRARRLLGDAAAEAAGLTLDAVAVRTHVRTGAVVPVLIELSRDAELVVLQRRQLSRLQRLVTGSVSAHVAGRAHAPTVSVPEEWQPRHGVTPHVTVGVDGVDDAEGSRLLRHAFVRALELGAELTVVHAWQLPSGYDDAVVDRSAVHDWHERYLAALRLALTPLRSTYPTVSTSVEIRHLHPAEALTQAAKDSDLVVLARGRLEHPLVSHLGSVARAVLRDAPCPVEVLHDR